MLHPTSNSLTSETCSLQNAKSCEQHSTDRANPWSLRGGLEAVVLGPVLRSPSSLQPSRLCTRYEACPVLLCYFSLPVPTSMFCQSRAFLLPSISPNLVSLPWKIPTSNRELPTIPLWAIPCLFSISVEKLEGGLSHTEPLRKCFSVTPLALIPEYAIWEDGGSFSKHQDHFFVA